MRRLFPKITVTILLGIVFLLGGAGTASAGDQTSALTSTTSYVFQVGGNNSPNYATLAECTTAQSAAKTSSNNPNSITTCVPVSNQLGQGGVFDATKGISTTDFLFKSLFSDCGLTSVGACIVDVLLAGPTVLWYFIYLISSGLLMLGGYMFDYSLFLSLDKNFIVQTFIDTSWTTMRDFSNMLFIFILLYTGIQTMLGLGKDWRGVVLKVIIVALLINFSLFFTKVVIDAGNVLAIGVYESMGSGPQGQKRELSGSLVKAFEPQKFTAGAVAAGANGALIIFVVATIINVVAAWAFFTTALIFVGRLMAFWFLMIISPFAFISIALPKGGIFGWWSSTLINQTFLAPVFLFCVYLILQIVNGGVLTGLTSTIGSGHGAISDTLIAPALIATLIAFTLIRAKDLAKSMAGEFGEAGSKLLSGALTTASVGARIGTAVATGGASMMVGGLNIGGKQLIKARGEGSAWNKFSKESTAGKFLRNSSFDVRNIGGDNSIFGHVAGGVIKQGVGQLGIGKGVGEGGVKASQDKQATIDQNKALKAAAADQMTPAEIAALQKKEMRNEADRIDKARDATKKAAEEEAAAKKAHDESGTADIVKSIQKGFEEASKAGNVEEAKKLAESLKAAKEAHASSDTGLKLVAAQEKTVKATEAFEKAQKHTATIIEDENRNRASVHARKAEAKGRYDTADKIRKGEKGGKSVADTLKELLEKEKKESGATTEPAAAPKH